MSLTNIIGQKIRRSPDQRLPFGSFMELALYHPVFGYYCRAGEKVGKEGDFYTSVSIGTVLAEVLTAAFLKRKPDEQNPLVLVEWGAGPGKLAKQILDALREMMPGRYATCRYELVETSSDHRAKQENALGDHQGHVHFFTPDEWIERGSKANIILFSNELLDAFPVERVRCRAGQYEQAFVKTRSGNQELFEWEWATPDDELMAYLDDYFIELYEGQIADISLSAVTWYGKILNLLENATMLHIDYGHETAELFAKHRMNGSLQCYFKHQTNDEPLERIGEQDITAHVHFSAFQELAKKFGWEVEPLVTQTEFLVREGVMGLLRDHLYGHPMDDVSKKNRAIKQLLVGAQMGDIFKVMEHRKA